MGFDINVFIEICLYILPLVIILSIIFSAILVSFARRFDIGMQVMEVIGVIFCIGVVAHELAHRIFCGLLGVHVQETKLFRVMHRQTPWGESVSIGGYVECEEIRSVIVALFIGFAPLLVNGLLVALLYYYGPAFAGTWYFPLIVYLGISLGLGMPTSKEDASMWIHALKRNPGRGILELIGLCCFGGVLFYLVTDLQLPLWGTSLIILSFIIGMIIVGRSHASGAIHVPTI
jgi:hypothetical protein